MAIADQPTIDLREPGGWRRNKNNLVTGLMYLAFVVILIPLGFVIFEVIAKGAKAISWQFLTNSTVPPNVMPLGQGGMGAAVVGTLEITGFAALIAIPLGILGAVYINEYGGGGRSWLAGLISFMSSVMVGVPSIVMGLFIFTVWVIPRGLNGLSGLAGSLALACLMLPLIIRSTYEMLRLVPNHLREASYALGSTKSRVTLTVVLPSAVSGIQVPASSDIRQDLARFDSRFRLPGARVQVVNTLAHAPSPWLASKMGTPGCFSWNTFSDLLMRNMREAGMAIIFPR